jgi:hypothetical protein
VSKRNADKVRTWRSLIDAWKQSGQTIHAFCRDRKLTRSNFDRWRRNLAAASGGTRRRAAEAFVPLRVVAEPMAEVVLRSGVVVRLPLTATPEAVTRLVSAVGAASC